MSKKLFLLLLFAACNLFLFNNIVFTNISQPNTGHTGAPGEQTCATSGCHGNTTIPVTFSNQRILMPGSFAGNFVNGYSGNEGQKFNLILSFNQNVGANYNVYGFSMTVLYENGTPAGILEKGAGTNADRESLSTVGGRQYLGHKDASSFTNWPFGYTLPSAPITQDIIFYIAANGGNDNGLADSGDDIFVAKYRLSANDFKLDTSSAPVSNITAEFDVNELNPCIGESITFNDLSTGNPNSYLWDFGAGANPATSTDPNPSVVYTTAGQKTVSLTASTGGSSDTETKTAYINVSAGPNADAGQDQSICAGSQAQLQASGGVSYDWSPSAGLSDPNIANPSASPNSTTTYTVTVTDANGCNDTDDVTISISNAPVVSINDADICPGESVVLDAGNPGFDYLWSDNTTGQTLTVSQGGVYSVTVSHWATCSASDTAIVSQLAFSLAFAGVDESICAGDSVGIGSGSSSNTSYSWAPSAGLSNANIANPMASPGTTTEYILTTTDLNTNCTDKDTVEVEVKALPNVQLSGLSASYCISENTPLSLSLSPAGGNLSGPGISGTDFTPSAAGLGTHEIVYEFTDQNTNCTASDTLWVEVVPVPVASIDNLMAEYCEYDNAFALQGSPVGGSFFIDGQSATNFDPTNLGAGTYEVEYVVSAGACADTATQMVDVIGNINLSISLANIAFCKGDNTPYALTGSPSGGAFSGFGVQGSDFIPALAGVGTGTISYVFDTASCQFSNNISATLNGVDLGSDTIICEGDSMLLDASVLTSNISWNTGSNSPIIKVSPNVGTSQEYIVSGTDANGCTTSDTIEVSSVVKPTVVFDPIDSLYCSTDTALTLSGSPAGGSFSGPGVSGNTFDPALAGVGGPYTLTYTYQSQAGCVVSESQQVAVLQGFSNPGFIGLDSIYCVNDAAVVLRGTPAGGNFSGTGVIDSAFIPFFAGVGTHTLSYGIVSSNGCGAIKTVQVEVKARPQVQFDALPNSLCSNDSAIVLQANPRGGVFSGAGVVDTVFYPNRVGVGNTNVISYTFTDSFSCSRKVDQFVNVLPKPNASILSHPTKLCEGDDTISLSGQPFGGQFVIDGILGNQFVADSAALGRNEVLYIVSAQNGCVDTAYSSIRVFARPVIDFDLQDDVSCAYPINISLSASPSGGVFTGAGVGRGNIFVPKNADLGMNTITYSYTDSNACSNMAEESIEILPLPEIELTGLDDVYCNSDDTVALSVSPVGGALVGSGISGNNFIPSKAGIGGTNVRYTVSNSFDCFNVFNKEVRVDDCTGVDELEPTIDFSLWPNPTNGLVHLGFSENLNSTTRISVLDLKGSLIKVYEVDSQNNLGRFELDLSELKSGIYLIELKNEKASEVKRIVRY